MILVKRGGREVVKLRSLHFPHSDLSRKIRDRDVFLSEIPQKFIPRDVEI